MASLFIFQMFWTADHVLNFHKSSWSPWSIQVAFEHHLWLLQVILTSKAVDRYTCVSDYRARRQHFAKLKFGRFCHELWIIVNAWYSQHCRNPGLHRQIISSHFQYSRGSHLSWFTFALLKVTTVVRMADSLGGLLNLTHWIFRGPFVKLMDFKNNQNISVFCHDYEWSFDEKYAKYEILFSAILLVQLLVRAILVFQRSFRCSSKVKAYLFIKYHSEYGHVCNTAQRQLEDAEVSVLREIKVYSTR